jgi:aminoglycoside 6'-N-acetyltransferase
MWIRASEAGKGLGTAALEAMLRWGFSEWPWERLFWRCSALNHASAKVAEKAGMIREAHLRKDYFLHSAGEFTDLLVFGALRNEWSR